MCIGLPVHIRAARDRLAGGDLETLPAIAFRHLASIRILAQSFLFLPFREGGTITRKT
jgi:hypothetical protein